MHSVALGVKQIKLCTRVIDHALPIARKITRIEILVISMTPDVLARGCAGIDVTHSFVVGEEVNTLAQPTRSCYIAIEAEQALELAIATGITP